MLELSYSCKDMVVAANILSYKRIGVPEKQDGYDSGNPRPCLLVKILARHAFGLIQKFLHVRRFFQGKTVVFWDAGQNVKPKEKLCMTSIAAIVATSNTTPEFVQQHKESPCNHGSMRERSSP